MASDPMVGAFTIRIQGRSRELGSPVIDVHGSWPDAEFSQHEHRGARLLVYGHCLLGPEGRSAGFASAVAASPDPAAFFAVAASWPGAYSAIVLRDGGMTAACDLAGQFPLYYSRSGAGDEVILGSDPALLAACHGRPADPVTLAVHIACPAAMPLWWGRSAYNGVARLEGGTILRVAPGSLQVAPERLPMPVPETSLGAGAARLRDALMSAVGLRCHGQPVSADFSGGMDSTTIGFLAAASCPQPVTAIAYHQPLAPAGDLAEASQFAALDDRVRLLVVRGEQRDLPFAGIDGARPPGRQGPSAGLSPEPEPGALTARRSALRLAAAARSGSKLHLTGEGGDAVVLAPPSYLGTLARQQSVPVLLRHCWGYSRLRYTGPVRLTRRALHLARTGPQAALTALAAELTRPAARAPAWSDLVSWWPPSGEAATWLTARVRREIADIAGDPATAGVIPDGAAPADVATLTDVRRSGDAQRHLRELARPWEIPVHAPFLDDAVIRAGLGVPAVERADPWVYKPLLQAAMDGLVPPAVLGRRTKGDYSPEDYRGARVARRDLRRLLRDSRLADLGVIEPEAVRAVVDRMADGVAVPLGPLNMLIATELWLRDAPPRTGAPARRLEAAARW